MFDFMDIRSWSCDVIRLICHTPHICTIFLTNIMLLGTYGKIYVQNNRPKNESPI